MNTLKQFASASRTVKYCTNTTLLYHQLHILPFVVDSIYGSSTTGAGANRLHYVYYAYGDGVKCCEVIKHADASPFFLGYRYVIIY